MMSTMPTLEGCTLENAEHRIDERWDGKAEGFRQDDPYIGLPRCHAQGQCSLHFALPNCLDAASHDF